MFGFGKKKDPDSIIPSHYEGLMGFKQDFPCTVIMEDDCLVFRNTDGNVAKLPYDRIQTVDAMKEEHFLSRYRHTGSVTKKGVAWFYVITYTSFTGEEKHISIWDIDVKTMKFFQQVEQRIKKAPTEMIL